MKQKDIKYTIFAVKLLGATDTGPLRIQKPCGGAFRGCALPY